MDQGAGHDIARQLEIAVLEQIQQFRDVRSVRTVQQLDAGIDTVEQTLKGVPRRGDLAQGGPGLIEERAQIGHRCAALYFEIETFVIVFVLQDQERGHATADVEFLTVGRGQRIPFGIVQGQQRRHRQFAPAASGQLTIAAYLDRIFLDEFLTQEGALNHDLRSAGAVRLAGHDQVAAGINRSPSAGHQDLVDHRTADELDAAHLQTLTAMSLGRRRQLFLGETVEDAAAAPRQGRIQLQIVRAEAGAVAVEMRRQRTLRLEARNQGVGVGFAPGDLAVGQHKDIEADWPLQRRPIRSRGQFVQNGTEIGGFFQHQTVQLGEELVAVGGRIFQPTLRLDPGTTDVEGQHVEAFDVGIGFEDGSAVVSCSGRSDRDVR